MKEITEYRGIEGLVFAEVLTDDNETGTGHGYTTGPVKDIAGVAELSRTTASSNETHYYDNIPAIVINSTGADEVTISTSAIDLEVLAELTGQTYDQTTGALIEGPRNNKYYALGYKTKKTNGDEVYVWRYKGQFNIPDSTHSTENEGTDANGQELKYTGISTTHKWTKTGKGAKALNVDLGKELADVSTFFDTVTTPDSLQPATPAQTYTLTITEGAGTTVTVTKNGVALETGATITKGDVLFISVDGGTLTVDGEAFTSGNAYAVNANVTVASTASA